MLLSHKTTYQKMRTIFQLMRNVGNTTVTIFILDSPYFLAVLDPFRLLNLRARIL